MDSLSQLADDIAGCRLCPRLVEWREQVAREKRASFRDEDYWGRGVPGFGDPKAKVLVLGLAPAAHGANRTGRMFTGDRSGDWLYRAMHRAGFANIPTSTNRADGLVLSGAWVAAAVRCAPPGNSPTPEERDACRPFLGRELALFPDLRVVVCLGSFAYEAACREFGVRPRPKFGHGVEVRTPGTATGSTSGPQSGPQSGPTLVCSFHPSQQNTFTGKLTEPMLDAVFDRARTLAARRDVTRR